MIKENYYLKKDIKKYCQIPSSTVNDWLREYPKLFQATEINGEIYYHKNTIDKLYIMNGMRAKCSMIEIEDRIKNLTKVYEKSDRYDAARSYFRD